MKRSHNRILTTHMGSLPRVGRLADLLLALHAGHTVDQSKIDSEVDKAMAYVVDKQIESGVDVGSDGEMPRTSFMLYPQYRMKGFGGETTARNVPLDDENFPEWSRMRKSFQRRPMDASITPAVVGELAYDDFTGVANECAAFKQCLETRMGAFHEPFISPLKKALLTGFHSTAKHNATKAVSPSSETMRTI